jgi:glycosyltransferase involved in cell wall biosynthesis
MDLNYLKGAIKGRLKPIGSWAWNRLNLARDCRAVRIFDFGPSQVREVRELMAKYAVSRPEIRTINWIVPHVKHPFFAGLYTILRFADYFSREKGIENRMFFYGGENGNLSPMRKKIGVSFPSLVDSIYGLGDGDAGKLPTSDISIATTWDSAYMLLRAENTAGKFYFVQDFEPLFYPAGATYGLVEATYRMGFWGIANTNGLGAHLRDSYDMTVKSFQPAVDPKMFYPAADRAPEPVKIFFYGRPRNPRNGFMLGIEALKVVKKQFKQAVQIVCAGAVWNPSDFGAEGLVENLGLLPTIDDVASLYRRCHIGLVFMFTKHPSYQPIEMMASGMTVVANENSALRLLLRNRENSLVVEPTVTSVAEAISCLVRDADHRNALALEGLKTAEQTCWNTEIEGVYEFLSGQRRAESEASMSFAAASHQKP